MRSIHSLALCLIPLIEGSLDTYSAIPIRNYRFGSTVDRAIEETLSKDDEESLIRTLKYIEQATENADRYLSSHRGSDWSAELRKRRLEAISEDEITENTVDLINAAIDHLAITRSLGLTTHLPKLLGWTVHETEYFKSRIIKAKDVATNRRRLRRRLELESENVDKSSPDESSSSSLDGFATPNSRRASQETVSLSALHDVTTSLDAIVNMITPSGYRTGHLMDSAGSMVAPLAETIDLNPNFPPLIAVIMLLLRILQEGIQDGLVNVVVADPRESTGEGFLAPTYNNNSTNRNLVEQFASFVRSSVEANSPNGLVDFNVNLIPSLVERVLSTPRNLRNLSQLSQFDSDFGSFWDNLGIEWGGESERSGVGEGGVKFTLPVSLISSSSPPHLENGADIPFNGADILPDMFKTYVAVGRLLQETVVDYLLKEEVIDGSVLEVEHQTALHKKSGKLNPPVSEGTSGGANFVVDVTDEDIKKSPTLSLLRSLASISLSDEDIYTYPNANTESNGANGENDRKRKLGIYNVISDTPIISNVVQGFEKQYTFFRDIAKIDKLLDSKIFADILAHFVQSITITIHSDKADPKLGTISITGNVYLKNASVQLCKIIESSDQQVYTCALVAVAKQLTVMLMPENAKIDCPSHLAMMHARVAAHKNAISKKIRSTSLGLRSSKNPPGSPMLRSSPLQDSNGVPITQSETINQMLQRAQKGAEQSHVSLETYLSRNGQNLAKIVEIGNTMTTDTILDVEHGVMGKSNGVIKNLSRSLGAVEDLDYVNQLRRHPLGNRDWVTPTEYYDVTKPDLCNLLHEDYAISLDYILDRPFDETGFPIMTAADRYLWRAASTIVDYNSLEMQCFYNPAEVEYIPGWTTVGEARILQNNAQDAKRFNRLPDSSGGGATTTLKIIQAFHRYMNPAARMFLKLKDMTTGSHDFIDTMADLYEVIDVAMMGADTVTAVAPDLVVDDIPTELPSSRSGRSLEAIVTSINSQTRETVKRQLAVTGNALIKMMGSDDDRSFASKLRAKIIGDATLDDGINDHETPIRDTIGELFHKFFGAKLRSANALSALTDLLANSTARYTVRSHEYYVPGSFEARNVTFGMSVDETLESVVLRENANRCNYVIVSRGTQYNAEWAIDIQYVMEDVPTHFATYSHVNPDIGHKPDVEDSLIDQEESSDEDATSADTESAFPGPVHAGFLGNARNAIDTLTSVVRADELLYNLRKAAVAKGEMLPSDFREGDYKECACYNVTVSGYSLGGGVAFEVAYILSHMNPKPIAGKNFDIQVVTYGGPNSLSVPAVQSLKKKLKKGKMTNWKSEFDIVPNVPCAISNAPSGMATCTVHIEDRDFVDGAAMCDWETKAITSSWPEWIQESPDFEAIKASGETPTYSQARRTIKYPCMNRFGINPGSVIITDKKLDILSAQMTQDSFGEVSINLKNQTIDASGFKVPAPLNVGSMHTCLYSIIFDTPFCNSPEYVQQQIKECLSSPDDE